jgi:PAS domain S-box-containing protein
LLRTLRSRHLLASAVVFAAMLGLLVWNAHSLMRDALQQRFADERRVVAPLLVAALGPLLATRDYAAIDQLLRANVAAGQLLHLELADSRGRVVANAGPAPVPPARADTAPVELAGQVLGEVRFVINTEALAEAQARLRRNSLVIGAVVLVAGLGLLTLATDWLGREFGSLVRATRRMAEGDHAARLGPSQVRELDEVARAFNQMASAVQSQLTELRDQQLFMRGVLDTLSEGYLIVDRDNRVVDCNETFLQLHGMRRPSEGPFDATITGARLLMPDGQPVPEEQRATRAVLASGQSQRDRLLRIERHDGSASWVSVNASPLWRGDERRPHAALATLTDVTRHIEAERSLRAANEGLEQRVRERTAELERARDEAERASRAKSEFLSRMSHELRTPLNAILGFAQLLKLERERLQPADLARLQQIESAGWHLLALINDVLDLARIEAGAMTTSTEPVELLALAHEAAQLVQAPAAARGIRLLLPPAPTEARAAADGVWLLADRKRLKQVLVNLLSNAVKYNRDAGEVVLSVEPAAGGRRAFAVRDTGRGFEPRQLAQLFQPFTRFVPEGDATEGTGIGLVITQRLLELMRGGISLQSEAGQGSVFRVELPLAEPPAAAPPPAALPPPPAPVATAPLRLLYVEDNPSNVELLRQVLRARAAWRLETAGDGLEGLECLRQEPFDGAIVDIDLPGIDGIELCRRVRADAALAKLPLLALSANAMPADVRRALAAGFDAYVTKPLDVAALLHRLDELLAPRAAPAPGDPP